MSPFAARVAVRLPGMLAITPAGLLRKTGRDCTNSPVAGK